MNRRTFLKTSLTAGAASSLALNQIFAAEAKTPGAAASEKLILSSPLTHSDWMLKPGMVWGPEGVRHMLDQCKAAGWSRIYWRTLDGGRGLYKSKLLTPMGKWDEDSFWTPQSDADKALFHQFNASMTDDQRKALVAKFDALDYAAFDPLAEAVRYGHQIGLQIHAWVSINEDDHGWGLQSRFSKEHPQFRWRGRGGKVYHSQLSFAYPEVRKYKLAILRELQTNYALDGFFLDWIRTGDVRDNPQNDAAGVADYGYDKPIVEKFHKKFGEDPEKISNGDERWVRMRAESQTEFMRAARKLLKKQPLAVMVGHPWHYRGMLNKIDGNLRGLLLDVATWAREGLFDSAVAAGYYRDGGNAEMAWQALRKETEGKGDIWYYGWVPHSVGEFEQSFNAAKKLGAQQILFWEADYIEGAAEDLKAAMRNKSL